MYVCFIRHNVPFFTIRKHILSISINIFITRHYVHFFKIIKFKLFKEQYKCINLCAGIDIKGSFSHYPYSYYI